ncbi:hypothetical protein EVAR_55381_1 [Eumeta japonica]|uniref:Uncharacterized protein n=1 Tax=Eumeta variegata TaxID=151549 RepID=A0A4C1YTJ2_EUMVA|nr:hypothetical protein EVAR_55381_1 [Eumeta japonica]
MAGVRVNVNPKPIGAINFRTWYHRWQRIFSSGLCAKIASINNCGKVPRVSDVRAETSLRKYGAGEESVSKLSKVTGKRAGERRHNGCVSDKAARRRSHGPRSALRPDYVRVGP